MQSTDGPREAATTDACPALRSRRWRRAGCSSTGSRAATRSPTGSCSGRASRRTAARSRRGRMGRRRDEQLTDVVAVGHGDGGGRRTTGPCTSMSTGSSPAPPTTTRSRPSATTRRSGAPARCPARRTTCAFAMVSCAKFNAGFFNAYARIAERDDLDFLLHLGDYIYEASNTPPASQTPGADIGRPFDPLHECVTLDDYRTRYGQYHRDPDVQPLHAAHPIIATLDDHEFADGAWRDGATEHKPEYGPWARAPGATRSRRARSGCRSGVPTRPTPSACGARCRSATLADLFLIDTRTRRDEPVPAPAMSDPDRTRARARAARLAARQELDGSHRARGGCSPTRRSWARRGTPTLPDDVRPALTKVKLHRRRRAGPRLRPVGRLPRRARRAARALDEHDMENVVVLSRRRARVARGSSCTTTRSTRTSTPSRSSSSRRPHVAEPRRQDGLAATRRASRSRPSSERSSSSRTGSGSTSTATATSSSTSRPSACTAEFWHLDTVLERSPAPGSRRGVGDRARVVEAHAGGLSRFT